MHWLCSLPYHHHHVLRSCLRWECQVPHIPPSIRDGRQRMSLCPFINIIPPIDLSVGLPLFTPHPSIRTIYRAHPSTRRVPSPKQYGPNQTDIEVKASQFSLLVNYRVCSRPCSPYFIALHFALHFSHRPSSAIDSCLQYWLRDEIEFNYHFIARSIALHLLHCAEER